MKYHVDLDGERVVIELFDENGDTFARLLPAADDENGGEGNAAEPGEAVRVELCPIRGSGSYSLLIGNESLPLVASGGNDELVLILGSETWEAAVRDDREAAAEAVGGAGGGRGSGVVRAVMPGIVRELRVAVGDEVEDGQALLILEAMKMQNEIRADHAGTVAELHVDAGTAVAKGDSLITLS